MHTYVSTSRSSRRGGESSPATINAARSGAQAGQTLVSRQTSSKQQLPRAPDDPSREGTSSTRDARFVHDFARVSVYDGPRIAIQAKLAVDTSGDLYEQEAERIAERVMGPSEPSQPVRTRSVQGSGSQQRTAPSVVHQALASRGEPLAPSARSFMEARFGHDFSGVRVHADPVAARSADAVNALAYTVGSDLVFGAGRYAPGTRSGDRLIAHELTHVVQQGARPLRLQRDEKKDQPATDPETELGNILRGPIFSNGFTLAFHDQDEPEAERRAADFAKRERAIGIKGKTITAANLVVGKAIPEVQGIEKTVPAIAAVVNASLAKVPAAPSLPPESAAAPGKVRALAVFAHGTPTWCSAGLTTGNANKVFTAIAPHLSSTVRIILYTCSSGRGVDEEEEWVKGTMRGGGKGSLASTVRDTLADQKIENASVWGHTTVGHTSRNFALREFSVKAGKGAEGESYASKYIFDDKLRGETIVDLADEITRKGYDVSATDAAFIKAASSDLELVFYRAYRDANKDLKGDNVAEDAPLYSYMTADRVATYWKDVYWPANRASVAQELIRRLKLKKKK